MKTAIYIGKFQPFHDHHLKVCQEVLSQVDQLIILVGSSFKARSTKLPFSFQERKDMIHGALNEEVIVLPIVDYIDDDLWAEQIDDICEEYQATHIVNARKDSSSSYIDMFDYLSKIDIEIDQTPINATNVRNLYFCESLGWARMLVPESVYTFMHTFTSTKEYQELVKEHKFLKEYKAQFLNYPYGQPIFTTVDALVQYYDKILMVQRKESPGKNLWALPGGFLDFSERIKDGMIRECKEETNIKLDPGLMQDVIIIDSPGRSERFRIITHVGHYIVYANTIVGMKAGDDAKDVRFFTFKELKNMRAEIYSDHFEIIQHILEK